MLYILKLQYESGNSEPPSTLGKYDFALKTKNWRLNMNIDWSRFDGDFGLQNKWALCPWNLDLGSNYL